MSHLTSAENVLVRLLTPRLHWLAHPSPQRDANPETLLDAFNSALARGGGLEGRRLLVVGPAGSGKSVASQNLATSMIDLERTPILVLLSRYDGETTFHAFLTSYLSKTYPVRPSEAHAWLLAARQAGTLGLILDGLDETPLAEKCLDLIDDYINGFRGDVILTCRSEDFASPIERRIQSGRAGVGLFAVVELQALSNSQLDLG